VLNFAPVRIACADHRTYRRKVAVLFFHIGPASAVGLLRKQWVRSLREILPGGGEHATHLQFVLRPNLRAKHIS